MADIRPFGESTSSGDPNIGVQKFCGATVRDFSVAADWAGQGGKFTVSLVEDDTYPDRFEPPVINAPKYFQLLDVSSGVVFSYGGVVESIARETSPQGGKVFTVSLASPAKILASVSVNMAGYAGYGGTIEGIPNLISKDGYYDIGPTSEFPSGYAPLGISTTNSETYLRYDKYAYGTNNNNVNIDWTSNYNVLNVFGAYENDDYYLFPQLKGYGSAGVSSIGMRLDRVMFALHDLVNQTSSSQGKRYLGGNILYGTNSYNPSFDAVPYYYGFDAIGFYEQVYSYLPGDFRLPSPNSTLLEIIQTVCEEANMEFMLELENSATFSSAIDDRAILQTFPNTTFGGTIKVRTFPKNIPRDATRPYSILSSVFLNLEIPDIGNWGSGNVNPGVDPGGYAGPFESGYTFVGTEGSTPYGGSFPVARSGDHVAGQAILDRVKSLSLSVQATDQIASRFIVGGKQSRIVRAGRDNICQYWGDIAFVDSFIPGSSGELDTDYRKIPVVTPILSDIDVNDFILIDTQDIFGTGNICNCVRRGIYVASVLEIRMAMSSLENWNTFMETMKPKKLACISKYVKDIVSDSGTFETSQILNVIGNVNTALDEIGNAIVPTIGAAVKFFTGSTDLYKQFDTTVSRVKQNIFNSASGVVGSGDYGGRATNYATMYDEIEAKLYEKIKAVGDEHYGQSWFVTMPYPDVKLTIDDTNIVGNFEKSWDLSDSAYLEPYAFQSFEAPRSNIFVQNGKISAYVNYEHSFSALTPSGASGIYTDIFSGDISCFKSGETYTYDFKEYDKDSKVLSYLNNKRIAHVKPDNVDNTYYVLPTGYFGIYDRSKLSYRQINNGSYSGVIPYKEGIAGADTNEIVPERIPVLSGIPQETGVPDLGARMSVMRPIIDALSSGVIPDHGYGCIHFAKIKTKRVYYPVMDMDSYQNYNGPTNEQLFGDAAKQVFSGVMPQSTKNDKTRGVTDIDSLGLLAFPTVIAPMSVGIPQISNRYYYGPWLTSFERKYAGKVEFVQDEDLVPENFLLPEFGVATNPFNFNFNLTNTISGLAGMNLAGQAKANSIDGSSLFAEEQGTLTMAGAPLISKIGDALYLNDSVIGPYITDISIKMNENSIETVYNFRTYTPRQNRTNRDIIKNITKLSNTVKKVTSRRK